MSMKKLNFAALLLALFAFGTVSAEPKEDRSYVGDFSDKKASLAYLVEGKENPVTFKEISGKNVVFIDSTGSDLTVERGSDTFKFVLKADNEALKAAAKAYGAGEWELAAEKLRPEVYPIAPLCALSEGAFSADGYVDMFITSLLNSGRLVEAEAFAKSLPIELASAPVINNVMEVADALCKKGKFANAISIVERVDLKDNSQFAAADSVANVLSQLKNAGKIKEILPIFSKLGASGNPRADEFKLWGTYCDIVLGQRNSAEIYLGALKIDRQNGAFSLYKMLQGDLRQTDPKKPSVADALDAYSEGIVFGKVASDWMPELLFKTGMAYKTVKNFNASNEIFAQIKAMYPESPFAAKGEKEVVKIEKKVVSEMSHDDDDEDDDDDE